MNDYCKIESAAFYFFYIRYTLPGIRKQKNHNRK